jgi:hypothetical protein
MEDIRFFLVLMIRKQCRSIDRLVVIERMSMRTGPAIMIPSQKQINERLEQGVCIKRDDGVRLAVGPCCIDKKSNYAQKR